MRLVTLFLFFVLSWLPQINPKHAVGVQGKIAAEVRPLVCWVV